MDRDTGISRYLDIRQWISQDKWCNQKYSEL